jgi:hypothetical protein
MAYFSAGVYSILIQGNDKQFIFAVLTADFPAAIHFLTNFPLRSHYICPLISIYADIPCLSGLFAYFVPSSEGAGYDE